MTSAYMPMTSTLGLKKPIHKLSHAGDKGISTVDARFLSIMIYSFSDKYIGEIHVL